MAGAETEMCRKCFGLGRNFEPVPLPGPWGGEEMAWVTCRHCSGNGFIACGAGW